MLLIVLWCSLLPVLAARDLSRIETRPDLVRAPVGAPVLWEERAK